MGSMGSRKEFSVEVRSASEPPVAWQGLLGYLNFSTGKPDPRFQGQFHAACRLPEILSANNPLVALADRLEAELARLQREGASAFADISQARAVIAATLR